MAKFNSAKPQLLFHQPRDFPDGSDGKPTMRETQVQSLDQPDPLEKEMATHSSTLAWNIPWTEDPGRLQSMGSQRVGHNWVTSLQYGFTLRRKLDPVPVVSWSLFSCCWVPFLPWLATAWTCIWNSWRLKPVPYKRENGTEMLSCPGNPQDPAQFQSSDFTGAGSHLWRLSWWLSGPCSPHPRGIFFSIHLLLIYMSSSLKWVSCRIHRVGSCFLVYCDDIFSPAVLWRCYWQKLCIFKVFKIFWYVCTLWNVYHNQAN